MTRNYIDLDNLETGLPDALAQRPRREEYEMAGGLEGKPSVMMIAVPEAFQIWGREADGPAGGQDTVAFGEQPNRVRDMFDRMAHRDDIKAVGIKGCLEDGTNPNMNPPLSSSNLGGIRIRFDTFHSPAQPLHELEDLPVSAPHIKKTTVFMEVREESLKGISGPAAEKREKA